MKGKLFLFLVFLNSLALLLLLGFSFKAGSLKKENVKLMKKIGEPVSEKNLEKLKLETESMERKILFFLNLYSKKKEEIPEVNKRLYFAQKASELQKRLKRRAELNLVKAPLFEFSSELPAEKEVDIFLKDLEILEEVVNLGIKENLDFEKINLLKTEDVGEVPLLKKIGVEISLGGKKSNVFSFLDSCLENLLFLDIEELILSEEAEKILVYLKPVSLILSSKFAQEVNKELKPFNFSSFLRVKKSVRTKFLNNKIWGESPEFKKSLKKEATGQRQERFYYRGLAVLKGKEVVVIEDASSGDFLFLALGQKIGEYKLKDFTPEEITLESLKNKKELIIKRRLNNDN